MRYLTIKTLKITILIAFLLLGTQVSLAKAETRSMNNNLNKTLDLSAMAIRMEQFRTEDLFLPLDTYRGELTAYVADCPMCSGFLACTGQNVLVDRTTHYSDSEYGEVRIVASSKSLPCGSIIQFDLPTLSNNRITAIVLDRGVLGTDIDLLMANTTDALGLVGRKQIAYDILRMGYQE